MRVAGMFSFSFVFFLLLYGCATAPSQSLSEEDYGPLPENYKEAVKEYFDLRLKDPETAKYRNWKGPYKGYSRKAPALGGGIEDIGYIVEVEVNARNSFGGYNGYKHYRILLVNGKAVYRIEPNIFFKEAWYRE